MLATENTLIRIAPKPLPANILNVQPGGGWVIAMQMEWGWLRRRWLRLARPGYVARRTTARRRGVSRLSARGDRRPRPDVRP